MNSGFWFSPGARHTISANASGFSTDIMLAVGPPVICLASSSPSSNVWSSIVNSGDSVSSQTSDLVALFDASTHNSRILLDVHCTVSEGSTHDSRLTVGTFTVGYVVCTTSSPRKCHCMTSPMLTRRTLLPF